jgi:segregation and condensation protein A
MTDAITTAGEAGGEEPFDAPVRGAPDPGVDALIVNLDGYEGPLHVLLDLARTQRVDIRKISLIRLVDQYLEFIAAARAHSLELAADYLVMAACLAFQLQRLEAMRKASDALLKLPQFAIDFFPRGAPEGVRVLKTPLWQADLFDLLQAYTRQRVAAVDRTYKIEPPKVFTIEEARARIERMLGAISEWTELTKITPARGIDAPVASVVASSFNAALEFARNGAIEMRQLGHFEPIYVRLRRNAPPAREVSNDGDR